MKKFLLIDTFNFLHRAYHALPKTFKDSDGNPTNAVYGVTSMILNIFETLEPDYVVAAIDGEDSKTLRAQEFEDYKAHRKPMDADLRIQIDPVLSVLDAFGIKRIDVAGYEADDIIGTIATKLKDEDIEVIIASNDRDLWQLVRPNLVIMLPNTKGTTEWLGEKEVVARLGYDHKYVVDYKGLKGDTSDNIPGVRGIGDKGAVQLINSYGNLESIYEHLDEIEPAGLRKKLDDGKESAFLSKKLATIVTDADFAFDIANCRYLEVNKLNLKKELEKHNFKSLIRRLGMTPESDKKPTEIVHADQTSLF